MSKIWKKKLFVMPFPLTLQTNKKNQQGQVGEKHIQQ